MTKREIEENRARVYEIRSKELARLQKEENTIEKFKREREMLKALNEELQEAVELQKARRASETQRKDQEKLRATDKLKKEMLEKIQITKTGRLSLT
jgi:hypothetical protein